MSFDYFRDLFKFAKLLTAAGLSLSLEQRGVVKKNDSSR